MNELSPAEKAKELYEWYYELMHDSMNVDWSIEAKCAAIKNVNEIIDAIDWHESETPTKQLNDWLDVRKELEKKY
jgi:hypothetical protein